MTSPKKHDGVADSINEMLKKVAEGESVTVSPELLTEFGVSAAKKLQRALTAREVNKRPPKTLYMSEIGQPCLRKLWYSVNEPSDAETITPANIIKFLYGDLLEDVALILAKAAGHTVEGEQESLVLELPNGWQVRGKRDAVINGKEWDVKTASGYGTKKFKEGLNFDNDEYGYIEQISAYSEVSGKPVGGFLVINKETGELFDSSCAKPTGVKTYAEFVSKEMEDSVPPPRHYSTKEDEATGNEQLGTSCSYCQHKWKCWQDANGGEGLRMFKYSNKVVYMTKVVKEPRVPELKPWEEDS